MTGAMGSGKGLHGALRVFVGKACIVFAAVVLSGCAGQQAFRQGQAYLADGDTERGLAKLRLAMEQSPESTEFRRSYFTQREAVVNDLLRQAEGAIDSGQFTAAREAFSKAARLDTGNSRALNGADRVDIAERHWKALELAQTLARAGDLNGAISKTQQVLSESPAHGKAVLQLRQLLRQQADTSGKELGIYPKLKAAYRVPVSLSFNNVPLLQVFEALKQASGLNYLIERDVKPDLRVTLSVTNKPVEDIIRLVLATNQLERRVLDDDTLLIYPNTADKTANYRELVVRTFYLSNADAGKVANMVRSIAKVRDVVVDEKLNMLMVRDSAEAVRLAEKLIAAQDIPEAEVVLDLEVLEVSVSRLLNIGVQWPDSLSAGVIGADGVAGQLRLNEWRNRNSGLVVLNTNDPLVTAQLRSQKGDSNLLANPRVRVRNKQVAKILIGERVPVITTISTANVGNSQSVSYLDVGLKLEIEPSISLDNDVSMKIALEVSNILETIRLSGAQAYRLGTRNTSTTLRVRDGETNILAGLIQREDRRSNTGIPGLNEAPLISKLFGQADDRDSKTEIVLLITPRIVHNLAVPGIGLQEFLSGTETSVGASPIQLGTPFTPQDSSQNGARLLGSPPGSEGGLMPSVTPGTIVPLTPPPIVPTPPGSP